MNDRTPNDPIGERALRIEDGPLLAGAGTFAADWHFPDCLHVRIARSSVAHGNIHSVDTAAAAAMDGVFAI